MIGKVFGNYRVIDKIGEGGMGAVYRAEHTMIGKLAALKVLLPQFSSRKNIVARFFNEAKAASAVHNAGIVEILDFGYSHDGSAYILMEFLHGEPLKERMKRMRALPVDHALHLMRQIARSLNAAHKQGIVHRDLKPDNIFIVPDDEVQGGERTKILDFGIAKLSDEHDSSVKTRTGAVMGTPTYMSPEQCKGAGAVDYRADIYSLGCILFEMLSGRPPFVADGSGEVMAQHIFVAPPALSSVQPGVTPAMDGFIAHLLVKDPDQRVQSARDMVATIDQFLGRPPGQTRASTLGGSAHAMPAHAPVAATAGASPTTLSAGAVPVAHAVTRPPGSRRNTWLLAALALLLVGGSAGVWLSTQTSSEPQASADEGDRAPATQPPSEAGEADEPAETPTAATEPVAKEPAAPEEASKEPAAATEPTATQPADEGANPDPAPEDAPAATATFHVTAKPSGTQVRLDGELVCKAPCDVEVPAGESRTYKLMRKGYRSKRITLPKDARDGKVTRTLKRAKAKVKLQTGWEG